MAGIDMTPFNNVIARLEGVAARLEALPAGGAASAGASGAPAASGAADEPEIAIAFDAWLKEHVDPVKAAAADTGVEDIDDATKTFLSACALLREMFVATGSCAKPGDTDWQKILGPVMELGSKAQKACDNRSDYFQDRKAIAEAVNIVTIPMNNAPASHVQNCLETMDFHAIKVMQKKNDKETAWIKTLKAAVKALQEWCKDNCKLGVTWKAGGEPALQYFEQNPLGAPKSAAAPKGKGKGKAPPPPPKGTGPKPIDPAPKAAAGGGGGMSAVFGAISGFSTSALKKVTDDMKTKNRSKDDVPPPVEPKAKTKAAPKPAARKADAKGPRGEPRIELEKDTNWFIENQEGVQNLTMSDATMQQLVVILNCRNTTVKLTGKVKNVCIDSCEKVNLICADVLSAVELVNSDRCQVQTTGKVNSFAIDKCNGVNVWLSKESLGAEIVTSKSSEMNLTIPEEGGDECDVVEMPIPEQFVTTVAGPKKLKTEVSSLYS